MAKATALSKIVLCNIELSLHSVTICSPSIVRFESVMSCRIIGVGLLKYFTRYFSIVYLDINSTI